MRGLSRVAEQCLLTAAVQNMKKIAMCCGSTYRADGEANGRD